ncbi:MAG: double-strand break repair protein AddB [Beijerinckiaceae bacterium]
MSARAANVFTIAPGAPFLPALVKACIDGTLGVGFPSEGRDFSSATIYVPTRRAARALAHAFAETLQPHAVLLPRIVPLGDPSDIEEQAILHQTDMGMDAPDMPPAINDLDRRLLLTGLIQGWQKSPLLQNLAASNDGFSIGDGFGSSYALSADLAKLIDEFAIEGADWSAVGGLVTEAFDNYWSLTKSFLDIAGAAWPKVLSELGLLDASTRLTLMLDAETERLKRTPPNHPVIAAGSTGTVPATARLLSAIARLPKGAVVLPGLDKNMDQPAWEMVGDASETASSTAGDGHPQTALKRLLVQLRIDREGVREIGKATETLALRSSVIAHSARSVEATEDWPDLRKILDEKIDNGLDDLMLFEAADERQEALGIAIALRGILEQTDKTAALITPDRALAQRVSAELRRWGIVADDSAGIPLSQTALGSVARLILKAAGADFDIASTAALLSCGLVPFDMEAEPYADARHALELLGFRGQELASGLEGLAAALDDAEKTVAHHHAAPPVARLDADRLVAARALLIQCIETLQPLHTFSPESHPLKTWAAAHQQAVERWAGGRATLGSDAVALGAVFDTIQNAMLDPVVSLAEYDAFLEETLRETPVSPSTPVQGRIKIWGLLEARLLTADRVVLGGLNEGIWPPDARNDAFLNRSMRAQLGLASPDRRIGQSAHDFAQAAGATEVVFSRAQSVEGSPMVASRFLRRLDAFVGKDATQAMKDRAKWLKSSVQAIDAAPAQKAVDRPEPRPAAHLQPPSLSITEIVTLYRDPYAIYARHILALSPLESLMSGVDARDRGDIIHKVLAEFVQQTRETWPDDPLATIMQIGEAAFEPIIHLESVRAFWWPMFEKTAIWFVDWEATRRTLVSRAETETSGSMVLSLSDGTPFLLRGRADRVDTLTDGTLAVIDYKSGTVPSDKQVISGNEPQLTLQAALAAAGAFRNVVSAPVSEIGYAKVGTKTGYDAVSFEDSDVDVGGKALQHIEGLKQVLNRLRDGTDPFLSHRMPKYMKDTGAYDHLSRTREWMADHTGAEE